MAQIGGWQACQGGDASAHGVARASDGRGLGGASDGLRRVRPNNSSAWVEGTGRVRRAWPRWKREEGRRRQEKEESMKFGGSRTAEQGRLSELSSLRSIGSND